MTQIMDYFPLAKPRRKQELVIKEIHKVMTETDKRFIILEAPVGSGKSAIALTIARWMANAHILTPLKSLQNQYYEEFKDYVTLMKGRNAYPCTMENNDSVHNAFINKIYEKKLVLFNKDQPHCGTEAACYNNKEVYHICQEDMLRECPYKAAINVAVQSDIIIHNFYSFIFQTNFSRWFDERELLIIDEAHMTESVIRDFTSKIITINGKLVEDGKYNEPDSNTDLKAWEEFFLQEEFLPKKNSINYSEALDKWHDIVGDLIQFSAYDSWKEFIVDKYVDLKHRQTRYKFTPTTIGNLAHRLIFQYGKKVLLLSGTIFSKSLFCKNLGINQEEAHFIRIDSDFPLDSRPIYAKQEYMTNTSHAQWQENFPQLVKNIKVILEKFKDVKGLIHVPSYNAGYELFNKIRDERLVIHDKDDFQQKLLTFFNSKDNKVFISPVCDQGVDFKDDRGRFQIITRVPYLNTGDKFVKYKLDNDFPWYNYQALVTFGQMLGRVNRSEEDFGVTILMDSRLIDFIRKNSKMLPKWLTQAIIYK